MEDNYQDYLRSTGNKLLKYVFETIPKGILYFFKLFPGWFQVLVLLLIIYYIFLRK
jgi:hypothetical protein